MISPPELQSQEPEQAEVITQRLWIGGLNPPNLTTEMVQKRIKATFEDQLEFVSFDNSNNDSSSNNNDSSSKYINPWGEDMKTFFFLTVQTKKSSSSSSSSSSIPISNNNNESITKTPFELISKQYHNVKWKGCSIQVELAKLHFLQRLEMERKEAREEKEKEEEKRLKMIIQQQQQNKNSNIIQYGENQKNTNKIRHLRIKKQHGEEAYMVDTKPIEITNWKELLFTMQKQRIKYKKHQEKLIEFRKKNRYRKTKDMNNTNQDNGATDKDATKPNGENLSLQSKVFLNRGVHLIFNHEKEESPRNSYNDTMTNDDSILRKTQTNYNWSDDEESNSDSEDTGDIETDDTSSSYQERESRVKPNKDSNRTQTSEYQWSDSSDGDSDDNSTSDHNIYNYFRQSNHNSLSEFESAVQDQPDSEVDNDIDSRMIGDNNGETFESLEDDVISNLNVLANIFPNIKVRPRKENACNESQKPTSYTKPGWNANNLIHRYDPTAQVDAKFEVDKNDMIDKSSDPSDGNAQSDDEDVSEEGEVLNINDDEESISEASNDVSKEVHEEEEEELVDINDEESISEESNEPNNSHQKDLDKSKVRDDNSTMNHTTDDVQSSNNILEEHPEKQIYEQKKLENIFQQKRTGGGTTDFQLSSLFQIEPSEKNDQVPIEASEKKGFSFSFDMPTNITNDIKGDDNKMVEDNEEDEIEATIIENSDSPMDSNKHALDSRSKLYYGTSDLIAYETKFFNLNEGVDKMMSLLDNDTIKQEELLKWEEERKTLTLDWKRKQKYALTKKNKRLRVR